MYTSVCVHMYINIDNWNKNKTVNDWQILLHNNSSFDANSCKAFFAYYE